MCTQKRNLKYIFKAYVKNMKDKYKVLLLAICKLNSASFELANQQSFEDERNRYSILKSDSPKFPSKYALTVSR